MPARQSTLYWHDYETTGADTRRDRPVQFAGLRTDADLNPLGEPLLLHCRPQMDVLPAPMATAVTGILPQDAAQDGLCEAEFAAAVLEQLGEPGTCSVGYNSLRFDDEITRHMLWRNLYDPYAREWRDGNSRWDVIDLFRLARALRPEGLEWPDHEPGVPSFRLEDLAAANGIDHDAHDALGDVHATLELTRRLRAAQPRLYEFVHGRHRRGGSADLLDPRAGEPVLHVSARYGARRGCIAPVIAVAAHPGDRNGVVVADLGSDISSILSLDADALAAALFTRADERDADTPEVPLHVVKLNQAPVVAPLNTLTTEAAKRLCIDADQARARMQRLRADDGLVARLRDVYMPPQRTEENDPDTALYVGFVADADRARMNEVHRHAPQELAGFDPGFEDTRLPSLYFRYRARNWPETLNENDRERWQALRWRRLCQGADGSPRSFADFSAELTRVTETGELDEAQGEALAEWAQTLMADLPRCDAESDDA